MPRGVPNKDPGDTLTRVTFITKDSELGKLNRRIAGIAIGIPEYKPIMNARPAPNGKGLVARAPGQSRVAVFHAGLLQEGIKQITLEQMREFAAKNNLAANTAYVWRTKMVKDGMLKPVRGQKSIFDVIAS